jgi:hypothetical protein
MPTTTAEDLIRRAALSFARSRFGRGIRGLVAVRVTGTPGLGGIWQCYEPVPQRLGGGLNSVGPNLHITSTGDIEAR